MIGEQNIVFGWIWINMGIITGMIMGFWAFDGPIKPPPGNENYSSLPRRLIRLGHVALIVLPIINILYGKEIDLANLSHTLKVIGSYSMILAAIGIPLGCFAAAYKNVLKYTILIPANALLIGTLIMAWGKIT